MKIQNVHTILAFAALGCALMLGGASGCEEDGTLTPLPAPDHSEEIVTETHIPFLFHTSDEIEEKAIKTFEDAAKEQGIVLEPWQKDLQAAGEALIQIVEADVPIVHPNGVVESPPGFREMVADYTAGFDTEDPDWQLRYFEGLVGHGYYNPKDKVHRALKLQYLRRIDEVMLGDTPDGVVRQALEPNSCMTCRVACKLDVGRGDRDFDTPDNTPDGSNISRKGTVRKSRNCSYDGAAKASESYTLASCGGLGVARWRGRKDASASWRVCKRNSTAKVICDFVETGEGACDNLRFWVKGHDTGQVKMNSQATCTDLPFFGDQNAKAQANASTIISYWGVGGSPVEWGRETHAQCRSTKPIECKFQNPSFGCKLQLGASGGFSKISGTAGVNCTASTGFHCEFLPGSLLRANHAERDIDVELESIIGQRMITKANPSVDVNSFGVSLKHDAYAERHSKDGWGRGKNRVFAASTKKIDDIELETSPNSNPNNVRVIIERPSPQSAWLACGGKGSVSNPGGGNTGGDDEESEDDPECHRDEDCDDGIACTVDMCNLDTCGCSNEPDDTVCQPGEDDRRECTNYVCDTSDGCQEEDVEEGSCDDDDPCTINDACGIFGSCAGESKSNVSIEDGGCDDGNECTISYCDFDTGECRQDDAPDWSTCEGDPSWDNGLCWEGECQTCFCDGVEVGSDPVCRDGGNSSARCARDFGAESVLDCEWQEEQDCNPSGSCIEDCGLCPNNSACELICEEDEDDDLCDEPEDCDDNIDNDGDGDIDCADPDCDLYYRCAEDCSDEIDNDVDGDIDCDDDDCDDHPDCREPEDCFDDIDNDGDDDVDCDDEDCYYLETCSGDVGPDVGPDADVGLDTDEVDPDTDSGGEDCFDDEDNDNDGDTDCDDEDCYYLEICSGDTGTYGDAALDTDEVEPDTVDDTGVEPDTCEVVCGDVECVCVGM